MTLDSGLTYDEHVTKLVSSCARSLCQINRARHVFDMKTLILLINALVFSKQSIIVQPCDPIHRRKTLQN
jgi:hypothetical protein